MLRFSGKAPDVSGGKASDVPPPLPTLPCPMWVGIFENEIGNNRTDKKRQQVHSTSGDTDASKEFYKENEATRTNARETKAEVIASIIGRECGNKEKRKEVFEWIQKRESKGKHRKDIYIYIL